MPYHQADIREQEIPKGAATGLMALSTGRAQLYAIWDGRSAAGGPAYRVVHRIWPGTQRMLLWGDPQWTAAYSRAFTFCGSNGVEIFEPLSFKGRRGSGLPGGRCAYADATLKTRWDWEKFRYTYRVWGRLLYNPEADPSNGAAPCGRSSAAQRQRGRRTRQRQPNPADRYHRASSLGGQQQLLAGDVLQPADCGRAQESVQRHAGSQSVRQRQPARSAALSRASTISPMNYWTGSAAASIRRIEVAQLAGRPGCNTATGMLRQAENQAASTAAPDFRRVAMDVTHSHRSGRFLRGEDAERRAVPHFEQHRRPSLPGSRHCVLTARARASWAWLAEQAKGVYVSDVTVGELPWLRGHWAGPSAGHRRRYRRYGRASDSAKASAPPRVAAAIRLAMGHPQRVNGGCTHKAPARFQPNRPLELAIASEAKLECAAILPARQPGGAFPIGVDASSRQPLFGSGPVELSGHAVSVAVLLRANTVPGDRMAVPGVRRNLGQSTLLRSAESVIRPS